MAHTKPAARTAQQSTDSRVRVPVSGGVLVYEPRDLGRELVGFEEVTDWDDLREALDARNLDRGAIYHEPVLDNSA